MLIVWHAKGDSEVVHAVDILKTKYPNTEEVRFMGDYFDKISIPDGIKTVFCVDVALKDICLPDSVEEVYLSHNKLSTLDLPRGIRKVIANNNILTHVTFHDDHNPTHLEEIDLESNRLLAFQFHPPPSLEQINLAFNDHLYRENVSSEILHIIDTSEDCYWGKVGKQLI